MHKVIDPKILYFGTPVVLVSTLNQNGTTNLAPISSAWWLDKSCMIGMSTRSKTVENLKKHPECVLNLPSADLVSYVDRLALLTGKNPVPDYKHKMGYIYEPNKFVKAGLTPRESDLVRPLKVYECPVQLEAKVVKIHEFGETEDHIAAIELKILRVHIDENLIIPDSSNHIDPEKWNPLIMNFCEFFGLSQKVHFSRLAEAFAPVQIIK